MAVAVWPAWLVADGPSPPPKLPRFVRLHCSFHLRRWDLHLNLLLVVLLAEVADRRDLHLLLLAVLLAEGEELLVLLLLVVLLAQGQQLLVVLLLVVVLLAEGEELLVLLLLVVYWD